MSRVIKTLSVTVMMILSTDVALALPKEDASQFALRYYQAVAASKSPLDVRDFLSARLREKRPPKGAEAALAGLMMLMPTPKNVKIVSCKLTGDKAILELAPLEIPQHYRDMAKGATNWSLRGDMELVDEESEWKVDKDMWKFSAKTKNGNISESSGIAGEQDSLSKEEFETKSPQFPKATDFEGQVREKLMGAIKKFATSSRGKNVYALITVDSHGRISGLKVRGENPQPAVETQISNLLVTTQPFAPLPAKFSNQRNIWMTFDWSADGTAISGPYFSTESHPNWLREKVGLQ